MAKNQPNSVYGTCQMYCGEVYDKQHLLAKSTASTNPQGLTGNPGWEWVSSSHTPCQPTTPRGKYFPRVTLWQVWHCCTAYPPPRRLVRATFEGWGLEGPNFHRAMPKHKFWSVGERLLTPLGVGSEERRYQRRPSGAGGRMRRRHGREAWWDHASPKPSPVSGAATGILHQPESRCPPSRPRARRQGGGRAPYDRFVPHTALWSGGLAPAHPPRCMTHRQSNLHVTRVTRDQCWGGGGAQGKAVGGTIGATEGWGAGGVGALHERG